MIKICELENNEETFLVHFGGFILGLPVPQKSHFRQFPQSKLRHAY